MRTVLKGAVHLLLVTLFLSCGGDDDTKTYSVGGTVSALSGSVELQCNGTDDITVTSDGTFVFPGELKKGESYSVTVSSQPTGQTCTVANGSGTIPESKMTVMPGSNVTIMHGSDVTDVAVECHNSGTLDTSFGTNGMVVHAMSPGENEDDYGHSITIDSKGRILVAGRSRAPSTLSSSHMVIWRCNEDGTLDTSFDSDGIVVNNDGTSAGDSGSSITIDSSGKILVTGSIYRFNTTDMATWRYNPDGTLDTSFGSYGTIIYGRAHYDSGYSITTDSSGRILVTGFSQPIRQVYDLAIWRYSQDGTLDSSFDSDGIVFQKMGYGNGGTSIMTDSKGKILVAGHDYFYKLGIAKDIFTWRYNPDGTLDTSFDSDGIAIYNGATAVNLSDGASSITIDQKDRILVTGRSENDSRDEHMVILRYNPDGSLDTTFDSDGIVYNGGSRDFGRSITTDSRGRILVAGYKLNAGTWDMSIWRYKEDGSLDTTFDSNGLVMHHNAAGGNAGDFGYSITTDSIGRILVAGSSISVNGDRDMVIWRYWP